MRSPLRLATTCGIAFATGGDAAAAPEIRTGLIEHAETSDNRAGRASRSARQRRERVGIAHDPHFLRFRKRIWTADERRAQELRAFAAARFCLSRPGYARRADERVGHGVDDGVDEMLWSRRIPGGNDRRPDFL